MDRTLRVEPSSDGDAAENRAWVLGIRASDDSALEAFFRATHEPLMRYAERFVSTDAAHDIVQEAFVKIWAGREQLDPERSLRAFAYRTVRNLGLNRVRDRSRRGELLQLHGAEGTRAVPSDAATLEGELAGRLERWIADLPERQREALTLSRVSGLTHEEVAQAMGLSARTVNNHLVRALRAIRAQVQAYDPQLLEP